MSHVVVVGGPKLAPIVDFLERETRLDTDWWVGVLTADDTASLNYRDSDGPLSKLAARLNSGELASVQMRRQQPSLLLVGLYRPKFCDEPPDQWTCILEGLEDEATSLYGACRQRDDIAFVSLSVNEAPELPDDLSAETFPWDDWRLVRAAVRSPNGDWEERNGAAV